MDVRLATLADAEAIRSIYNAEVTGSSATFDMVLRSIDEQHRWLAEHSGAHPAIVAVQNTAVLGFGCLSTYRARPGYTTTVEDSVYIDPSHRGRGMGHAILDELLRLATAHGFHAVMARIADGNPASIALHRAAKFDLVGVELEVGRKFGRWLDVTLMQRLLESGY
ncbi:MAG: GNAT family N-acetyltransferase [Acidimicrobiales bacterium]|nr:MAG: GNAT family N-acetyltransferase [Acidimicrobiales bacterium]